MRALTLTALPLAALAIAGCLGSGRDRVGGRPPAAPRVLTLADGGTDPSELIAFTSEVRRLSRGSLRVDIRSRWRKGQTRYETGLIRDVQAGKVDLGWTGARAWDTVGVMGLRALGAPLLVDNYELEEKLLRSDIPARMLAELQPLGLVGLGILPGQFRRPLSRKRALLEPSDFAGLTIGGQRSRVAADTFRALGARSRWLPVGNSDVSALDAVEQRVTAIDGSRYDAPGTYLARNVDLWPRPLVLFAGSKVFAALDRDQQRALRQAAANAVHRDIALDRDLDREATGNVCRRANAIMATASASQLRALRRAVQPVYDDLRRDPRTRTFIDAIERLKRDLGPLPPDALPACPPTSRPVAGAASAIDGVYHMTSSIKRDSKRDPTPVPENYGTWTFVFSHGRFAFDQEDHETGQEACTWGYGTFRVKGDQVQWLFEDGGGIAPTGALNKPGEFFVFRWSRYRDTLALSPVRGEISPWNFRVRPWRLVSRTPTRRYFDRRCPPPAGAL